MKRRRTRALLAHPSARMAIDPGRVVMLRPFGSRTVVEHDRAAVRMVEHLFTTHHAGHDLDLLHEIDAALPRLMFRDF
jgi:hypothetical protein